MRSAAFLLTLVPVLAGSAVGRPLGVPLALGDSVTAAIESGSDTDRYVFPGIAGTALSLTLSPAKGEPIALAIDVVGPDGAPIDLGASLTDKNGKLGLKGFPLPATGAYVLRIGSANGEAGAYDLKTKGKPPRTTSFTGVEIPEDEARDFGLVADTDAMLKVTVKWSGGEGVRVVTILDPAGRHVPGLPTAFVSKKSALSAVLYPWQGFGEYVIRLASLAGATRVDLSAKAKFAKVKKRKLVLLDPEPVVNAIEPAFALTFEEIAVSGYDFQDGAEVWFGDSPALETTWKNAREITAIVPNGAGEVDVTVVNPDGRSASLDDAFTFVAPAPWLMSFSPSTGPAGGGTVIDVRGRWLGHTTRVVFAGEDRTHTLEVVDDGHVRFTTPPHPAGVVDFQLFDRFGQSDGFEQVFVYQRTYRDRTAGRIPDSSDGAFAGGEALALGDVDGDDDLDLFLLNPAVHADYGGYRVSGLRLFLNSGTGSFPSERTPTPPPVPGDGLAGRAIALGDLDGDGDLDAVVVTDAHFSAAVPVEDGAFDYELALYPSTRVLLNDGKGTFTANPASIPDPAAAEGTALLSGRAVALGDLDGDGDLDLVTTHEFSAYTSSVVEYEGEKGTYGGFVEVVDYGTPATRILLNDGNAVFTDETDRLLPPIDAGDLFAGDVILLRDFDHDDDLDIILSGSAWWLYDSDFACFVDGPKTRILQNIGDRFRDFTALGMPPVEKNDHWGATALATGDLDDNGWMDLVLSGRGYYLYDPRASTPTYKAATRILFGDRGQFTEDRTGRLPPTELFTEWDGGERWAADAIHLTDVDGDGDLDLFLTLAAPIRHGAGGQTPSTRWLMNEGTFFRDATGSDLPDPVETGDHYLATAIALGDVDGDDDLDVLLTAGVEAAADGHVDYLQPTRLLRKE